MARKLHSSMSGWEINGAPDGWGGSEAFVELMDFLTTPRTKSLSDCSTDMNLDGPSTTESEKRDECKAAQTVAVIAILGVARLTTYVSKYSEDLQALLRIALRGCPQCHACPDLRAAFRDLFHDGEHPWKRHNVRAQLTKSRS